MSNEDTRWKGQLGNLEPESQGRTRGRSCTPFLHNNVDRDRNDGNNYDRDYDNDDDRNMENDRDAHQHFDGLESFCKT